MLERRRQYGDLHPLKVTCWKNGFTRNVCNGTNLCSVLLGGFSEMFICSPCTFLPDVCRVVSVRYDVLVGLPFLFV